MKTEAPQNYFSGTQYQGQNAADLKAAGFPDNQWATYKQWLEGGWQVQKGQHGTAIMVVRDVEGQTKKMVKFYKVFNIAQVAPIEEVAAA